MGIEATEVELPESIGLVCCELIEPRGLEIVFWQSPSAQFVKCSELIRRCCITFGRRRLKRSSRFCIVTKRKLRAAHRELQLRVLGVCGKCYRTSG